MKVLRNPESRFEGLEGYPFSPHHVDVAEGLRMHYVDEGPPGGAPVLLRHGEPTWSYLCFAILASIAASIRGARRFEERRVLKLTHALSPGTEMSS